MDYDHAAPFDIARYREMQRSIPGVEGLYRLLGAIGEAHFPQSARLLLVGAGGGRELETLGVSAKAFSFVAVDPSTRMLAPAKACATAAGCLERTDFIEGEVFDVPETPAFDGATSLLVMHFLPDDGSKLRYLQAIRKRLTPGSCYFHADVCFDGRAQFDRFASLFLRHAELAGLSEEQAALGPDIIAEQPIIGETRSLALLREAGFADALPCFRGLWYAAWLAVAA